MNAVYLAGTVFFVTPGERFAYLSVNEDTEMVAFETNGQKLDLGQDYIITGRLLRSAMVKPSSIVKPPKKVAHTTLAIFDATIGLN
jgi:hypothetical protein